ncbi:lipopolysaccharide biosynthesis protein [Novosphingobium cyanobacteriorum]|uniref:Teichoic acid transporter n=1 Tax=Novosphingobium cyanobacteriorum TaxID=3024215 RepID=A0ABT6CP36_9SPHN|nr:teichoic acid transporter [Novosphingobium cyanobacteriorum]MDF8334998.1 teichoic acid transporter [Novosphingobium cyanobacteriorum]
MVRFAANKRLGRSLLAQIYSQAVTIVCQLALVPLLLGVWGPERYGAWLVLAAVPTFLTFSDFGFTFVAKNEMTIAVSSGRKDIALETFQSVFSLINVIMPFLILAIILSILSFDLSRTLNISISSETEIKIATFEMVVNVILYQYFLLICAGVRCENRPATEAVLAATSRLAESVAYGVAAIFSHNFAVIAFFGLASRVTFIAISYVQMKRLSPWLKLGTRSASLQEVRRLAKPALAYMLVPISQAVLIQGPVVLLGAVKGPLMVVVFSTTRTLVRVGTSAANMFNNAFVAEYSSLAGNGDTRSFFNLYKFHAIVAVSLVGFYSLSMVLLGPLVLKLFTHGKVEFVHPFAELMLCAVALEMIWTSLFTPLSSINRHVLVTYILALLSLLGMLMSFAAAPKFGINGVAAILVAVNVGMVMVCFRVLHSALAKGVLHGRAE